MKCPVCGSKLHSFSYSDDIQGAFFVVESGVNCTKCDYRDFDSYGQYVVSFGDNYFEWSWDTPGEEKDKTQKEIEQKLKLAKPRFYHRITRYYSLDFIPF